MHGVVGCHGRVPLGGEAGERKSDKNGIVEGKKRQERHRDIQEREVGDRVGLQADAGLASTCSLEAHLILAVANLSAWITRAAIAATAIMLDIARAAPSGQLLARPNWTWTRLAIITPSVPPTKVGVT